MRHCPRNFYSAAMNACALCSAHLMAVPALGFYLVGHMGEIQYLLRRRFIQGAMNGLPFEQLRWLDHLLERRATELGLSSIHDESN